MVLAAATAPWALNAATAATRSPVRTVLARLKILPPLSLCGETVPALCGKTVPALCGETVPARTSRRAARPSHPREPYPSRGPQTHRRPRRGAPRHVEDVARAVAALSWARGTWR